MVRKIARSGVNIVLITQTLQDIIPEITRVVLMKNGRILEDGPKEKILTARHIGALFDMRVRISRHDGYYYAPG
jgi:iron complex transport system ATP-binding protein